MPAGAPARMIFPLMALEAAGPLRSKAQLHMLAHALQRDFGGRLRDGRRADGGWYDFSGGRAGPHSAQLDRDMRGSQHLVEHEIASPFGAEGRTYHRYALTGRGTQALGMLKAGAGSGVVGDMEGRTRGLCADMPAALLEDAYGAPAGAGGPAGLAASAGADAAAALSQVHGVCDSSDNWRGISYGAILETVGAALAAAASMPLGGARLGVVAGVSCDIVRACGGIADMTAPGDPAQPDERLADAEDLTENLCRYCERHGIMRDPMTGPRSETISEDDVYALCLELRKVDD